MVFYRQALTASCTFHLILKFSAWAIRSRLSVSFSWYRCGQITLRTVYWSDLSQSGQDCLTVPVTQSHYKSYPLDSGSVQLDVVVPRAEKASHLWLECYQEFPEFLALIGALEMLMLPLAVGSWFVYLFFQFKIVSRVFNCHRFL